MLAGANGSSSQGGEAPDSSKRDNTKDTRLTVADARQRDVGHGKVRTDNKAIQKLGKVLIRGLCAHY